MSPRKSFLKAKDGASAVEFALIAPMFFMVLLTMLAFGIYLSAANSVQQIAADAARTAIAGLTETERNTLVKNFVDQNAAGYPFIDKAKLTVVTHDNTADGNQFVVSASYDARNLPIWYLLSNLPLPSMTIARQSTIRVGGI